MSEQFENTEIEDALSAALRVLAAVKNADTYDEIASAIAERYAQRSDFNRAVEIADSISDPFTMEKAIADIAVMLAATGQEDGAFELVDSIEDFSHKAIAMSQIAVAHAAAGEFDRAIEIATEMDDNSSTLVDIAYQYADKGDHDRSLEVSELLDFPLGSVSVRIRVARDFYKVGRTDEALDLLSRALDESEEIDPPNERAGALAELARQFYESGREDTSAEILALAMEVASEADVVFQDAAFSQVAIGHARLKQYDAAVSISEKIENVYVATSTLIDLAVIEHENDERHAEAVLLLSDARDLIIEDEPQSQQSAVQHNYLQSRIALTYADFDQADEAMTTAVSIGELDSKNGALSNVGILFARSKRLDQALKAANAIDDESYRTGVLIRLARVMIAAEEKEQGTEVLSEASRLYERLERPLDRAQAAASLAIARSEAGQVESVAPLIRQAIESAKSIADPGSKAVALLSIADTCSRVEYSFDEEGLEALWVASTV